MTDPRAIDEGLIPREHQRVRVEHTVRVEAEAEGRFETRLHDVSLGGVGLDWPHAREVGSALLVRFTTDLYFHGEVRWCRPEGAAFAIGVRFRDLDDTAAIYMAEYIHGLSRGAIPAGGPANDGLPEDDDF